MEALIMVATSGGPTMFAHGVMRALNRHTERVFNPDRKDHHWGRRKLARDLTPAENQRYPYSEHSWAHRHSHDFGNLLGD